jgi:hypothetical protein
LLLFLCCTVLDVAGFSLANAQEINKKPMTFSIVRTDGKSCEKDCSEWIAAQGQIVSGSAAALAGVIRSLKGRKLPILIDSVGGDVNAGLGMGQLIREKGFDVVVAKTHLEGECSASDMACIRQARLVSGPKSATYSFRDAQCASACTFVLAGGVRRVAMLGAHVGVHQLTATRIHKMVYRRFYVERRRVNGKWVEVSRRQISERVISQKTIKLKSAPDSTNRRVEAHFKKMGLDPAFFALTMATPAESVRYLSQSEVQDQRVGTHVVSDIMTAQPTQTKIRIGVWPNTRTITEASTMLPPSNDFSVTQSPPPKREPTPFTGYILLGSQSAEIALQPDSSKDSIAGTLRLMENGVEKPSQQYRTIFDFQDGFSISFTAPHGQELSRPLKATFDRIRLCHVTASSLMTITLLDAADDSSKWIRTASVTSLLPFAGIKAALCP